MTTAALVIASIALAAAAFWSCRSLFGMRTSLIFFALAAALGGFAEEMGSTRGWFFGSYRYTDVLGPRIGSVPAVIPLMWFGLCHCGFVLACLVLWRKPEAMPTGMPTAKPHAGLLVLTALMTAMIVTAFDLGADPYFVYVLKAWIMDKKDGDWFGETVRGFEGWMLVSFVIVALFQWLAKPRLVVPAPATHRFAALLPVLIYLGFIVFQVSQTEPVALRVIAFFAMGIPALIAGVSWAHWVQQPHGAATR